MPENKQRNRQEETALQEMIRGLMEDLSMEPDSINWLIEDLSMVPERIIKIAVILESLGFKCKIQDDHIAFSGNYDEFKLFLNEDMSARLNSYIHIAEGHSEPFLNKMARTPNMQYGINRKIESDEEYIFSIDIPLLKEETCKEQLEYYTWRLHDYEFELFHIM